jgi:hypothetical protein
VLASAEAVEEDPFAGYDPIHAAASGGTRASHKPLESNEDDPVRRAIGPRKATSASRVMFEPSTPDATGVQ